MRLRVISIGQRMAGWVSDGWMEYARRMPPELPLELRELPMAHRGKNAHLPTLCEAEGKALLAAAGKSHRLIALDEKGKHWSTVQLANRLEHWMEDGRHCDFLVGGPDGLSQECLNQSHERWSLSALTFPHPLVRVVLAEQLYRAWTVTRNHPYHRA